MDRAHLLQQQLPVHRLHLGRRNRGRIEVPAVRARFGRGALQDLDGGGAPDVHLDAVALVEIGGERSHVLFRDRGVQSERAFLLRPGDEPLEALGPAVQGELGKGLALSLRAAGERDQSGCERGGLHGRFIVTL